MRFQIGLVLALLAISSVSGATTFGISTPFLTASRAETVGQLSLLDLRTNQLVRGLEIEIEADTLHVETDSVAYANMGPTAVGTQPPQTTSADYAEAKIAAFAAQGESGVFLIPSQTAFNADLAAMQIDVPAESCRPQPVYFARPRPAACPDLASSFSLRGGLENGDSLLVGGFQLHFFGWNGTINHAAGTTTFWSGAQYALPQANVALGPSELRSVILEGTGTIRLHAPETQTIELLAHEAQAVATDLAAADGSSSNSTTFVVERIGEDLGLVLTAGQVHLPDGSSVAVGNSGNPFPWAWLLIGFGAVVAAPPAIVGARRLTASSHLQHARDNIALENFHSAARHAEAALHSPPHAIQASVLGAIALIRANDLEDARFFVEELERRENADPAAVLYLEACLAAKAGDRDEARRKLDACIEANAAYLTEAQANPILESVQP